MRYSKWSIGAFLASASAGLFGIAHAEPKVSGDVVVAFDSPQSIVDLGFGAGSSELKVTASSLSLASADPFCAGSGCTFNLNHLVIRFGDFSVDADVNGHAATFFANQPAAVIEGPLAIQRVGSVLVIPQGTPSVVRADVSGGTSDDQITPGPRSNTTGLPSDILIGLDSNGQVATIDGSIDFSIPVQGVTLAGTAAFSGANASAFINLPPVPNAGPPQTVKCPGFVTLNGSLTTDPENNVISYFWDAGESGVAGGGPIASLFFGPGLHSVVLTATDEYNSQRQATTSVNVQNPAPTITAPPDITISACVNANIGQPVFDGCGVSVTNDAPARFPIGTTVVTWTATDGSGRTVVARQRVTAILGDDPSCCPPGTNVIIGTDGPDNLVGTAGSDCILGRGGDDTIDARDGNDFISGGSGRNTIMAGIGNDFVWGGPDSDTIDGSAGNDFIDGAGGVDTCSGGTDTNAIVNCEIAAFCTASCCSTNSCTP